MEPDQKAMIMKNLVYLTENTTDLPKLFLHLVACNALSDDSKQKISGMPTNTEKVYAIYIEVQRKPIFSKLIEILDTTGNEAVADKIRGACQKESPVAGSSTGVSKTPGVSSTDDFQISDDHFVPIKKILENMENLEQDWLHVLYGLKMQGKSRKAVNQLNEKNVRFGTIILETLSYWQTDLAEQATFRKLVEVIRECHPLAASELNKNAEKIRNS